MPTTGSAHFHVNALGVLPDAKSRLVILSRNKILTSRAAEGTIFSMTRAEVYREIDRERAYQATLDHTRTDGCAKSVGDYIVLAEYYARKANDKWTENAGTVAARHMLRKLAAVVVAALEVHDCPPREDGNGHPFDDGATRRHGELTKQAVAVDAEFKQTLAQIMGRNPDPTKSREFRATEQLNESDAAKVHNEASIAYQQHIGETPEQSNRLTVIDVEHKQVVGEAEQQNIINAATLVS